MEEELKVCKFADGCKDGTHWEKIWVKKSSNDVFYEITIFYTEMGFFMSAKLHKSTF